ncbi:MAG: hypothetical protein AAFO07_01795 [Bacteroidota bacterium]
MITKNEAKKSYQYGGHGFGMLPNKGYLSSWPERLLDWLKRNKIIPN